MHVGRYVAFWLLANSYTTYLPTYHSYTTYLPTYRANKILEPATAEIRVMLNSMVIYAFKKTSKYQVGR